MAYELTAHDRGLELLWKPGSQFTLMLCPEHGLYVVRGVDLFAKCGCGKVGEEYIPESIKRNNERDKHKRLRPSASSRPRRSSL